MEMSLDRILGIVGAIGVPAGFGFALAMDSKSIGELRFSQACFAVSGIVIVGFALVWAFTSDAGALKRALVVALCFAMAGVGSTEAIRWTQDRNSEKLGNEPSAVPFVSSDTTESLSLEEPVITAQIKKLKTVPWQGIPDHSQPQESPSPPPVIVEPNYGDLAGRVDGIVQEIDKRLKDCRIGFPARLSSSDMVLLDRLCSNSFRSGTLQKAVDIRNELAQLHFKDDDLDERLTAIGIMMGGFQVTQQNSHLNILQQDILGIRDGLARLAAHVKGAQFKQQ
jgi:hypothetical protein